MPKRPKIQTGSIADRVLDLIETYQPETWTLEQLHTELRCDRRSLRRSLDRLVRRDLLRISHRDDTPGVLGSERCHYEISPTWLAAVAS